MTHFLFLKNLKNWIWISGKVLSRTTSATWACPRLKEQYGHVIICFLIFKNSQLIC